jgi:hypothetical protein
LLWSLESEERSRYGTVGVVLSRKMVWFVYAGRNSQRDAVAHLVLEWIKSPLKSEKIEHANDGTVYCWATGPVKLSPVSLFL